MQHFDFINDRGQTISLKCLKSQIEEAAIEVFTEWAEADGVTVAIEQACGQFWKEGEANALATLTGSGNFWAYLQENTKFFDSEEVMEKAQKKAVYEYQARGEDDE